MTQNQNTLDLHQHSQSKCSNRHLYCGHKVKKLLSSGPKKLSKISSKHPLCIKKIVKFRFLLFSYKMNKLNSKKR